MTFQWLNGGTANDYKRRRGADSMDNNAPWPRLLDIHLAARYLSIGESTVRDYCADGLLHPVELPGSTLRDRKGKIISRPEARKLAKILLDREDLNRLVERGKERQ